MSHQCLKRDNNGDTAQLDACCQYGVDVDLGERDKILFYGKQIKKILTPSASSLPWFESEEIVDNDFVSGSYVRTKIHGTGCIFLSHERRGCAIHRASQEGEWDFHGVKPHVCRLFPISYTDEAVVMSDDYTDYSCAHEPNTPTVYQVGRPDLLAIFGIELVLAMDAVEKQTEKSTNKQLTVVA